MHAEQIRFLRREGKHAEARQLAIRLAAEAPQDAELQYEAACVHDYFGFAAEAVPCYLSAIAAGLAPELLRRAYLGLGSTYRALGKYGEALVVLERGAAYFPGAREFIVFRAMVLYNLGRSKEAVEALLGVIAETATDPRVQEYSRAIAHYAADMDRTWRKP